MNRTKLLQWEAIFTLFHVFSFTACRAKDSNEENNETPTLTSAASYSVLVDEDITYAEGLARQNTNVDLVAVPLKLDVYYPDNDSTNRPVHMFIHGGGFTGGTKTKPEIMNMADYYASRGWVFVSIDYRTTEELGSIIGTTPEEISASYTGIAPSEWTDLLLEGIDDPSQLSQFQQGIAMYTAQRDSKAALRWIVANSSTYGINTDFITVGGASAGAITTIALGISDLDDFRDEISTDEDSTLSTTNLNETYEVQTMVYFWGSNVKLELFEAVYGEDLYDSTDPELFMAHGTDDQNPTTTFTEATELQGIYDTLGIYNELVSLDGQGHGAWNATVDGKGLSEMSFDFIVSRQNLIVE